MKINKDTWHYKLWDKSYGYDMPPDNTNLCDYCKKIFWEVSARVLLVLIALLAIGILIGGPCFAIYAACWKHNYEALTMCGVITASAVAVVGVMTWIEYMAKRSVKPKTESNNLLVNWFKAKKEKVCPLIEFADD
jgi:uncharacterized membrane protein YfbV (UPF0208 family)